MVYYLLVGLYLLVCLLLLLVVLMQQGKGGDMASAFGGGGSSQTAFGARAGATVLTRATTVLGALFMIGAIILGVYGQRGHLRKWRNWQTHQLEGLAIARS
jgi:preprotein translocase subunit SecG